MLVASILILTIEDNEVGITYALSCSAPSVREGGQVTIAATASRTVDANTEVVIARAPASTAGADDFSLQPPLITIMVGDTTGALTLTATDDEALEGAESLTLNGTVGDTAAGSVTLTIEDRTAITYTLSGPADSNLVEGRSYELTATASSAVKADTTVQILRDAAASDAGADDYLHRRPRRADRPRLRLRARDPDTPVGRARGD